ncbi:MAG: PEP-utilizing enzyme [Ilumatobacter sp.]
MDIAWDPPGPGTWELDRSHFAPTVSRLMIDLMESTASQGVREGMDIVGAPLDTMDVRFVNGQMYRRLVPIIGGASATKRPPPAALVRAVFAVHPRLRRRVRTAGAAMTERSWRAEAERWEQEWKPELVAANRRLAAIDHTALDDADLAMHLDTCVDHLARSMVLHFRLHISDLGPIGRLLNRTDEWGIDRVLVMSSLAGASPSTSEPKDALRPLAALLSEHGVTPATLDEVRSVGVEAERLLDAYLLDYGTRLTTGYDLTDRTLGELPHITLTSLADPMLLEAESSADRASARGDAALHTVRVHVPEGSRDEFDELIDDARRLYGLRDENGPLTVEWPGGVTRLVILEVGRRLAAAGRLLHQDHVADLSGEEMSAALRGQVGPKAEAVATRHDVRVARNELVSPAFLGPEPVEPDLASLPSEMREMMQITVSVLELLEAAPGGSTLTGTGIGTETYAGVARVVVDAADAIDRVEPGDVVVTQFTAPTFNSILAIAGAVVTEHGGLLCHTAVIARELGIAGIVGVSGALDIPDGARVEVNPSAGTVQLLEAF